MTETGIENGTAQGNPSESTGTVKVSDGTGSQVFQIAWAQPSQSTWSDYDLETKINDVFTTMANNKNVKNFTKGTLSMATLDGNTMLFQSYSLIDGHQTIWGVQGVYFLNKSNKLYSFTTLSDNDLTEQSALSYFHYYVDSFVIQ